MVKQHPELALDILNTTGITATAGIGPNLYLAKVAMDIWAKHTRPDKSGVRIAELDELSYRKLLWDHRPLTDFWRVGRGCAKKLEAQGLFTMGDIARCSIGKPTDYYNEELLYRMFGVNAELLIDHAWGYEPVTMADVKAYKPEAKSVGSGQVLTCPYDFDEHHRIAGVLGVLLDQQIHRFLREADGSHRVNGFRLGQGSRIISGLYWISRAERKSTGPSDKYPAKGAVKWSAVTGAAQPEQSSGWHGPGRGRWTG